MNEYFRHLLFITLLSFCASVNAQKFEEFSSMPDDSLFIHARELAFSGYIDDALTAALALHKRNPSYHDASVLLGRIYAWDGRSGLSLEYIHRVIIEDPCHYDALSAQIDALTWSENYDRALEAVESALDCHPDDELFLYNKAYAFYLLETEEEAEQILVRLLDINPENRDALELRQLIKTPDVYYYRENNYLLGGYHGEFFEEPYSRRMHIGTAGYSYYTGMGPVTGKINFGNIYFDGTGMSGYPALQYEIETYPSLPDEGYLFLNYAFSMGSVFPRHRGAFEIFRQLPGGFKASLGIRMLYWNDVFLFYTGSLAKYYSDFWFSLRPYIFTEENGLSASWYLNARKYFSTADDFAGIILGYGISPDETLADLTDRIHFRSASTGAEFSKGIGTEYLVRGSLLYKHEEIAGRFRGNWIFSIGLRYYL